ncbi:MAG: hypothetical protein ABI446_13535 [Gemmatimonadaceae bacterium]
MRHLRLHDDSSEWSVNAEGLPRRSGRWSAYAVVLFAYCLLLALSASEDPGDTRDYANSIAQRFANRDLSFWEAGHLFWRPLGYLVVLFARHADAPISAAVFYAHVVHSLTAMSVVMGAVALLAFLAWAQRCGIATIPAVGATLALATTCAFLNYAQTGAAYVSSLAMFMVGLWALETVDARAQWRDIASPLAFSICVLFWLPMMFSVPVAAASPLILRGDSRRRRNAAAWTCVLSGALVVAAYLAVAEIKHIHSIVEFRHWLNDASHGIENSGGLSRTAIGLARSVVSTGQLGITAKRFLLHDSYSPATAADVVRAGLYRVAIFYGALGILSYSLARKRQSARVFAFLVLGAIPVLAFAVAWQGGDLERYFPIFPALFLAIGVALSALQREYGVLAAVVMVALLAAFNIPEYSRTRATRTCAELESRLHSVTASNRTHTLIVTMGADELSSFRGRCPDARELEQPDAPGVVGIFTPHSADGTHWREFFAKRALDEWRSGGRVLISSGLLAERPPAQWHWAEGDDPRVSWGEFPAFFDSLATTGSRGDARTFLEVLPSAANEAALERERREPAR